MKASAFCIKAPNGHLFVYHMGANTLDAWEHYRAMNDDTPVPKLLKEGFTVVEVYISERLLPDAR